MSEKKWFVHMAGETMGPLSTERIAAMLQKSNLQFSDFIWCVEFTKWIRVSDVDTFVDLLPAYPKAAIPKVQRETLEVEEVIPEKREQPEPVVRRPEKKRAENARIQTETKPAKKPAVQEKVWDHSRRFIRVFSRG